MDVTERLKIIEKEELMMKDVRDGNNVFCDICGELLYFVEPNEGKIPGVFCEKQCTSIQLFFG